MSALYQDKGSSDWEFLKIYSRLNVSLLRPLLITLQQTWVRVADASHSTSSGRGGGVTSERGYGGEMGQWAGRRQPLEGNITAGCL